MTLTLSKAHDSNMWRWTLRLTGVRTCAMVHALTPYDALNLALLGIHRQLGFTVTRLTMGSLSIYPTEWRMRIGNGPEFRGAGPFESMRSAFEHAIGATMMADRSEYVFDVEAHEDATP